MAGQRGKESCGYSYMTFVVVVFLSHHKDVWQPAEKNVSESNVRGELRSGKTRERSNHRWVCQDRVEEGVTPPPGCNLKYLLYSIDMAIIC